MLIFQIVPYKLIMQLVIVVLLLFMVVLVQPVTGHGPPSYDQLLRENSQLSAINRKLSWKIRRLSEKGLRGFSQFISLFIKKEFVSLSCQLFLVCW